MDDADAPILSTRQHPAARITEVECIPLHIPFRVPFKIASGAARPIMETLLVKVRTDAGVVGIGETHAWRRQGSAETLAGLVNIVKGHFEPRLLGRSPFDIAAIMHDCEAAMYHTPYAQAAVGDALYDIVGKLLDVPVHRLLGGKSRQVVRVAAVLSIQDKASSMLESAAEFHAAGFRHLVLKIGVDPREDLANAEALRKAYGDKIELRVDANAVMDYDGALRLLKRLEPLDIETAEQPLAIWNVDGMAALARAVAMPLMADECVTTAPALLEIIAKRAASSAQTKIAKNGGIHRIMPLWHMLAAAGMGINPGNHPSTSVATAAVAQMCGAWPGPLMAGVFAVGVSGALAEDIVENPIRPMNGEIAIPDGPGLGVTLDEAAVRRFRVEL
jgi:L-alanine-DL-glutamate epimerase-like enolase superfamily enzyme